MIRNLYKRYHNDQGAVHKRVMLSMSEAPRAGNEILFSQLLKRGLASRVDGEGQGVIVIPGFLGTDGLNKPLVKFLNSRGFKAFGWMDGRNTGPKGKTIDKLTREVEFRFKSTGQKVSLVGHSLGGIYAREIAKKIPEQVQRIVTLGSPFSRPDNDPTMVNKVFRTINSKQRKAQTVRQLEVPPEVPTSSVFSRADGVIQWRTAIQSNGHDKTENIEVYGSHCGLSNNASVWFLLLDRLQRDPMAWQKFDNSGWRKHVFPLVQLGSEQNDLQGKQI